MSAAAGDDDDSVWRSVSAVDDEDGGIVPTPGPTRTHTVADTNNMVGACLSQHF